MPVKQLSREQTHITILGATRAMIEAAPTYRPGN
jgi:hypothetical protein